MTTETAETKRLQIPVWVGWRFDEHQTKRKAAEEKLMADAWGTASDVVHRVLAKMDENPVQQEIAVRLDGLPDRVVDAVVKHIREAEWVVSRVKQSGLNNLLVFDISERPADPTPEEEEADVDEEGDARVFHG